MLPATCENLWLYCTKKIVSLSPLLINSLTCTFSCHFFLVLIPVMTVTNLFVTASQTLMMSSYGHNLSEIYIQW